MRLLLTLEGRSGTMLPANYNYPLASAVYNLLHFGSPEFATYLHDIGYRLEGKTYKLFTFALRFERMRFAGPTIHLLSPKVELHISSPLIEEFIHSVVLGTFEQQQIRIDTVPFVVRQVETLPEPEITDRMKFMLLSPLVLSTKREHNGKLHQYFLRPDDMEEINRVLTSNLLNKYSLLTGKEEQSSGVQLEWDREYLRRHERVTRKITLDERDRAIDIIAIQAPFELHGDPTLIRTGYNCGFGEKNAMGFGMAKALA